MSKSGIIRAGVGLLLAGAIIGSFVYFQPSTVERHKAALTHPPFCPAVAGFRDYFSSAYLRWILAGRPSNADVYHKMDKHRESLVALGVLSRRTFVLEHQQFISQGMVQFDSLVRQALARQALASNTFRKILMHPSVGNEKLKAITVVGLSSEMDAWAEVIRRFDAE